MSAIFDTKMCVNLVIVIIVVYIYSIQSFRPMSIARRSIDLSKSSYINSLLTKSTSQSCISMVAGNIDESAITKPINNSKNIPIANMRNLKQKTGQDINDNAILSTWNELKGLSEKELLTSSSIDMAEREERSLSLAYRRCEYVTELFSKTFYMGTTLMRSDARKHVWAIYAWCRRTDDLVDSPRALLNCEHLQEDLDIWYKRLDKIWDGKPEDLFDMAMANTVKQFPGLKIQPFRDMIAGMVMDVPGIGKDRYQNFEELYLYCYRVAGTVGLMTLPILGAAKGYTQEQAAEPAIALGIAFQLTNILRDVGEDLERGRIYLPKEELDAFNLSEDDLFSCEVTEKYKEFTKFQIARARDYYRKAQEGIPMLASDARIAVQASLDLYSRILDVIERNGYDNFRKRAYTSKFEKLTIIPGSILAATFPKKH